MAAGSNGPKSAVAVAPMPGVVGGTVLVGATWWSWRRRKERIVRLESSEIVSLVEKYEPFGSMRILSKLVRRNPSIVTDLLISWLAQIPVVGSSASLSSEPGVRS